MEFRLKTRLLILLLTVSLFALLSGGSFAQRQIGTPVKEAISWGAYLGPGKSGNRDTIYLSFSQYEAPLFLLAVHPDTGEVRQFKGPLSSEVGAWGFAIDQEDRIYLGSHYGARLLRFDPRTETWDDLGRPAGEKETFVCSLTTAPDGKIWGGTFPSAQLFSYDPKTGLTRNFGRMDPDQFYCYPTAGGDGLIYCAIQFAKTDIVVFDPVTGDRTSLIPPENRKPGRVSMVRGKDGKVYARISTSNQWFTIEGGKTLAPISESEIPYPPRGLPDGRQFWVKDDKALVIQNPATKDEKTIPLQYEATGAFIFVVSPGPDGRIYGSSMLPLQLFVYDPQNTSLSNLGEASLARGEVYSMGSLDGKLYLCSYPEARLSVYDPKRPIRFGDREGDNPRDLGPMGDGQYRPRAMVAGPHGRVYIGGYPDYGHLGGAITAYDPKKNDKRVYRHIIQNQSIASMAYVEKLDLIAAGSSVRGGSGTRAVEKEAKLILWDPKEEKKILETTPVREARTILSLAVTRHGMVYGITNNEKVFVLDPEKREVRKVFDLGLKDPREISLQIGPDGRLYGLAREAIFAIEPEDDRISILTKPGVEIDSGMAMLGRKIYYGSGAALYEFEIPAEPIPKASAFPDLFLDLDFWDPLEACQ